MRLIDADRLLEWWKPDIGRQFYADQFIHTIEFAPTIEKIFGLVVIPYALLDNKTCYVVDEQLGRTILGQTEREDEINRQDVLTYIDRVANSGMGKKKSLEYIRKYVEKTDLKTEPMTSGVVWYEDEFDVYDSRNGCVGCEYHICKLEQTDPNCSEIPNNSKEGE